MGLKRQRENRRGLLVSFQIKLRGYGQRHSVPLAARKQIFSGENIGDKHSVKKQVVIHSAQKVGGAVIIVSQEPEARDE